MAPVIVPVIGLAAGGIVLALALHGLRPGAHWKAMFPVLGVAGACLALVPAAYTVSEPRLPLIVAALNSALFAGAWALVARDPAYQPKPGTFVRTVGGRYEYRQYGPVLSKKLFRNRRSLTGAGMGAAIAMIALATAGTLRARHEAELGIAGLWLGGGFAGALFGAIPAYLVGGLAGTIAGLFLPPEPSLIPHEGDGERGRPPREAGIGGMIEEELRPDPEKGEPWK